MTRKAFSLFVLVCLLGAADSLAATNALVYSDNFENYTNSTPLINGTNYWHSSTSNRFATVQTNVVAPGSTNAAMIPSEVTLSNRYQSATLPDVWLRMYSRIVSCREEYDPVYDTNSTTVFFVNSNGYFVVRNGTNGWTTLTRTLAGANAEQVAETNFHTIDVYMDYDAKTWRLSVNSVRLTNNIAFINTNATKLSGFDVYSGTTNVDPNLTSTSYLDNVSVYNTDEILSVFPSVVTNRCFSQTTATNQSFKVIASGDSQLNYYVITNNIPPDWSMRVISNATGTLTNYATNTVWVSYNTASLSLGIYTNSFNVISTNGGGQTQTVQIVMNVYSMGATPTNLSPAALYGYTATNQATFGVNSRGGSLFYSVSTNVSWMSVNPASGYVLGGTTNTLTNTYSTSTMAPGDYTGQITVRSTDSGTATSLVGVALRIYSTPVFTVTPSPVRQTVDKGGNPTSQYFEVWNSSASPVLGVSYQVTKSLDVSNIIQGISSSSGVCSNQHNNVGISFNNLSTFSSGTYTAVLAIAITNYGSGYAGQWSGASNVNVILTVAGPDAPSRINATKGDYDDRVAVNWSLSYSPLGGAVTYNLLRHITFDPAYANTIVSGLTVTNYNDTTVSSGAKYYYWVQCVNTYGQIGANSSYDAGYRRLAAPSGLFASDGEYTNKVAVSWAAVDGPAVSYYVYRGISGSPVIVHHTTDTAYDDNTAEEGVEYTYYVQASNSVCGSVLSSGETGYVLARPTVFSASDGQYVDRVVLTWGAVHGATAYEIWRSTQPLTPPYGGGVKIGEATASYSDTAVTGGRKYYYWLKAKNATALSSFSAREEGYAASASVDLSLLGLIVQPRRIVAGGHPSVVSFRLVHNGGSALAGDNGTVRLTFYASANDVFGDGDDQVIGTVSEQLTLGVGSRGIFGTGAGNITLPTVPGSYYIYMRLNPIWPSTLAPTTLNGWVTRRAKVLEVSTRGSINYQALNDYDGDGVSDLVVHGSGLWNGRSIDDFEFAVNYPFGGSGVAVMGDYDGDRKTDLVVYNENTGLWQALFSGSGYAYASGQLGGPGNLCVSADYDGDGKIDPAVYNTANSVWYALKIGAGWLMSGVQFGNPGYEPIIGDYDGDGIWDLAVYDENNGLWYIRSVSGTLILSGARWGGSGYRPVPGDYDGDGLWDFAVYDNATYRWYVANIYGEMIVGGVIFGAAGYRPVSGDFDGDGIYDFVLYNPTSGKWYIYSLSSGWLLMDATWGGAGHKAVGEVE